MPKNQGRILAILFFISGFCSLLYQVVWLRLAFAAFGVITPVVSVLLSVFMLGLALGSWGSGKFVAPLARRTGLSPIRLYALSEIVIAVGAFVVPWLFCRAQTALLGLGEADSFSYLGLSALMLAGAILPWCVCMGATFPLMMAHLKETDPSAGKIFSFLYCANVFGAMAGTLVTGYLLLEVLGFRRTLWMAGLGNVMAAVIAYSLPATTPVACAPSPPEPTAAGDPPRLFSELILFATGFTALAMEVVWTRQFTVVLGTHVYGFSILLFTYLSATWAGSYFYRRALAGGRPWAREFLLALLAAASLLPIVINDPRIPILLSRLIGFRIYSALALGSIFVFCALLGYLTPSVIDDAARDDPARAGRAYALNVLGCILGPLAASYVLLPCLGVRLSLVVLALPYGAMALFSGYARRTTAALVGGLTCISLFASRSYEVPIDAAVLKRDHTATVVASGEGRGKMLFVNGVGMTGLSPITKFMAHLPLVFHQGPPQTALVICFGMGTTYRALLSWGIQATAVELVPSVRDLFGYYFADAGEVGRGRKGRIVIDDGRRFLMRSEESFDVITIDPPPPVEAAGSSLLYSSEFYELIKRRLKPGGVLQQWFAYAPLDPSSEAFLLAAAARSLTGSFPYVRAFRSVEGWGLHFIASQEPLAPLTAAEAARRMPDHARADLLEWAPDTIAKDYFGLVLSREIPIAALLAADPSIRITDDQPLNEYYLLRRTLARR